MKIKNFSIGVYILLQKKLNKLKLKSEILIIAGSDSSGGAGIQADIKTVTALGSYAMTAITAVTSQNTNGVKSIVPINPKEIYNQIIFTSKDIKPNAIKIGMLHSTKVIESVIKSLKVIKEKKIILDPVMVAKGGTKLINDRAIKLLKSKLIQKAGAFSIVLECLSPESAKLITRELDIPTIGIGSSSYCDGQILVTDDMLGLSDFFPKFVKKYSNLKKIIETSFMNYARDVKLRKFPSNKNVYK